MTEAQNYNWSSESGVKPLRLRDALRQARIDSAGRTGVVVDLRDAELARLEILNEALDPLFAEIPNTVDMFDRGLSQGETPRLWIDAVAHVQMGRDKRLYRFVQDTTYGRTVLSESHDPAMMANAITDYVARRMIEREQAIAGRANAAPPTLRPRQRWLRPFVLGFIAGTGLLFGIAVLASMRY